jgi:transketolase
MAEIKELENIASQVRRDIVRMVHYVSSGHPGGSLGCTDFLTALYFNIMKRKKRFTMEAKGEDVFFLSNGHISPVFYSVLAHAGYFPPSELATFRRLNSRLQGHPTTHESLPGVRIASGSLGQGVSVACGVAKAKKMDGDKQLVFTLTGDGELQEGQNWEAFMFAAHHKLDNMVVVVDWNGQQIDGSNDHVMSLGDLPGKFKSFGWEVVRLKEGNNMEAIVKAMRTAKRKTGKGKPVVVLMNTIMGYGVDFMMGSHEWHGIFPNKAQTLSALSQNPETLGDFVVENDTLKV